jgi:hypothetical protein
MSGAAKQEADVEQRGITRLIEAFDEATAGAYAHGELPPATRSGIEAIVTLIDDPKTAQAFVDNLGDYGHGIAEGRITASAHTPEQARERLMVLLKGLPQYGDGTESNGSPQVFVEGWYNPRDWHSEEVFRTGNRQSLWGRLGALDVNISTSIRQNRIQPMELVGLASRRFLEQEAAKQ